MPEEPQGSKEARARALSPLVEVKNVWLPAPAIASWVGALIEECAGLPTATNDDQVDALSQALNRLILQPLLAGRDLGDGSGVVTMAGLNPAMASFGAYIQ